MTFTGMSIKCAQVQIACHYCLPECVQANYWMSSCRVGGVGGGSVSNALQVRSFHTVATWHAILSCGCSGQFVRAGCKPQLEP